MKGIGRLIVLGAMVLALAFLNAACGKSKWVPDTRNSNSDALGMPAGQDPNTLQVLWKTPTLGEVTHAPLVRGVVVYFADWDGNVFASSTASGTILWQKALENVDPSRPWRGFCGTGVLSEDILFEASAEGTLFAIDLRGGTIKWKTRFTDKPPAGNTGTLLYYDKMVYVPVSSVDEVMSGQPDSIITDFQGKVQAFDALSGKSVWEFKTVTGPANGVPVRGGFALDQEAGIIYFTTGNNFTGPATEFANAIIALDAKTGAKKWVKQCASNYDFRASPQLVDATIDGKPRKLVIACQKSGALWALDRMTGDVVWSDTLGVGAVGGGFLAGASVEEGGIYAWANNAFTCAPKDSQLMDVAAFEPGTGKAIWKKTHTQPAAIGAGFAAGGFYYVGSLDGLVRAYNVKTGDLAWTSTSMGSVSSPVVVAGGKVFFGSGVPIVFGGNGLAGAMHCIGLPMPKK